MSNTLSMKNLSTIISSIKTDILSTSNRVLSNANLELIGLYHRIGKIISDNSEYGNNFIETLSKSIKTDYPDAKGFSPRNLSRMKRFYEEYPDLSILPMPLAKLPWSVLCLLIEKIKSVLLELGKGFSFVGNQYRISTRRRSYLKRCRNNPELRRKALNLECRYRQSSCPAYNSLRKST